MDVANLIKEPSYAKLRPGDPAPWFEQRAPNNPTFRFDTIGGRFVILCFFGSSISALGKITAQMLHERRQYFDDINLSFFGVTLDPTDESEQRIKNIPPGIRFFYDYDGRVSTLYGSLPRNMPKTEGAQVQFLPQCVIMDRLLRVLSVLPFQDDGKDLATLVCALDSLPPFAGVQELDVPPPVLMLPRILEPELCRYMIGLYEKNGGHESGFMNEEGGKTMGRFDPVHKRRRDYFIDDPALLIEIRDILQRRLVPEISKTYQYNVTHIERYIVACYDARDAGHFNAHRDNTTTGTAHRRFAVTLNLNDAFEGGELSFPEFGKHSFKPPTGGAVVFSCSLLHAASTVTQGVRYAFLPFLYDEAAAKIRDANHTAIIPAQEAG
jgi:peroxiredoxin